MSTTQDEGMEEYDGAPICSSHARCLQWQSENERLKAKVIQWELWAGWLLEQHLSGTNKLPWRVRGHLHRRSYGEAELIHPAYGRKVSGPPEHFDDFNSKSA